MKTAIIFDIDKTIANNKHREYLAELPASENKWRDFHTLCDYDPSIQPMIQLIDMYQKFAYKIIFCTARPEYIRHRTRIWLDKAIGNFGFELFMRAYNDDRPSFVIKKEMLDEIRKEYYVLTAFDDSQKCVDMYVENGVLCLKPYY